MSESIAQQPSVVPETITAAMEVMIDRARALGLTWTMRLGTVNEGSPNKISVVMDGDITVLTMTSMIGAVAEGQRVYVIMIPPAGNFIVGVAGFQNIGCRLTSGTIAVAQNISQAMTFTSAHESIGGRYLQATGTTVLVPFTGVWTFTYAPILASPGLAASRQAASVTVNSADPDLTLIYNSFWGVGVSGTTVSAVTKILANDTLTFAVFQSSYVTVNTAQHSFQMWLVQ